MFINICGGGMGGPLRWRGGHHHQSRVFSGLGIWAWSAGAGEGERIGHQPAQLTGPQCRSTDAFLSLLEEKNRIPANTIFIWYLVQDPSPKHRWRMAGLIRLVLC